MWISNLDVDGDADCGVTRSNSNACATKNLAKKLSPSESFANAWLRAPTIRMASLPDIHLACITRLLPLQACA
jgi:hypothetical protein